VRHVSHTLLLLEVYLWMLPVRTCTMKCTLKCTLKRTWRFTSEMYLDMYLEVYLEPCVSVLSLNILQCSHWTCWLNQLAAETCCKFARQQFHRAEVKNGDPFAARLQKLVHHFLPPAIA